MGFSRQEYWSGQLFPSPGDLPNPETEPRYTEEGDSEIIFQGYELYLS